MFHLLIVVIQMHEFTVYICFLTTVHTYGLSNDVQHQKWVIKTMVNGQLHFGRH